MRNIFLGKPDRDGVHGDNIKMDLMVISLESMDWIHLA
jgi:hypothetical protein